MAAKIFRINYKSDFILTMNSDAGWAIPFCIKFWTSVPSRAYFVGFDGTTYTHCAYDPSEPTKLVVQFDDHHLPIGDLNYQIAYHFTVADFPNDTEDEVINPAAITTEIDGETYHVMLDFTGETAPEIEFNLPAYANEQQRIQNELQRQQNEADRIAAELQREQATAAAVEGAENVNAQLNGTTLTVTNRNGVSTSVNTKGEQGEQGPVGPQGEQGETGISIVSFTPKSETSTTLIYTVTFSDGHTQDVPIPKGAKGDTGATGPQGPQGDTGVSIVSFTQTGSTTESLIYTVTFSDSTTQQVAIPKGAKGDTGPQGPVGPQGPQGPMGDVAVITPEQQAAFTMYSVPGQNTDGPMTQKAVTDAIETEQKNILTGFQIAVSKKTTGYYGTSIGFEKGKRYHIRVTASATYTNGTAIILQTVSQQYEGQVGIGTLPANALSVEFDYYCKDDNLQYFCTYASGNHTVTYGIVVSEYLKINEAVNKNRELLCPQATYINFYMTNSFVIATSPLTRAKYYMVQSGQKFRIKANNSTSTQILFLTALPETLSNNQDLSSYKVGSLIGIAPNTEKIIEIPATAGIMWVNVSSYYQGNFSNFEPEYVSIIDEGSEGFNDVSNSNEWILKNGAFFGSNGKYALHNGSAFKYIPVQVGEKYVIVTNSRRYCNYALMRSIPATIRHWTDIDAVGYGEIPNKKDLTLEIPSGCNYLAVSVANAYQDYEPAYIGKSSSTKSLNDNTIINTALINNVNAERILLIPVYGQSLAIGGDATPITTYCRFPKNCANNTTLGLQFGQSLETSIYGLVESYIDFKGQEDRIPATRQTDIIASFSSGQGSTPISGLIKGTTLYNNLISSITSAYNARAGIKLIIPAFCWIQGEGDIVNGVDYYYNELAQLRSDLDADIKAITGQTEDVHCIVYQTNQLCPTAGSYYNPTAYASGGSVSARMDGSVVALWELVRDSQYFHVSSPIYPMNFVVSPNKAIIHISGVSQKLLGYYEGLAAKRLMDGHGDDIGLYVTNVTKVDNTHIRLSLHVPAPPIVVDTESVYETANYGFSVINENSQNIISGVSIERNNLDATTILITTNSDCTNAKLRYGVNGTNGYSGFDKGPRGNIRDSQGLWYKAVINNRKVPMHNWLLFFEYLIN